MKNSDFKEESFDRKTKICEFLFHFFFIFTIVVLLLELFGVIDEAGIIFGIIGVISTIYFGMITATNKGIGKLSKEHKAMTRILRDISEILRTRK